MRSAFVLVAVALVAACSVPVPPTAPVERARASVANDMEECRSGWLVRTGRSGVDSTYTGCTE